MYQSIGWNAPAGMRWQRAPVGYRLACGGNTRAVIVPVPPRAWNGFNRWRVDALAFMTGRTVDAATLADARRIAEHGAT